MSEAAKTPLLRLEGFEGPMDLLLALAKARKVDLTPMSMISLADQFIASLTQAIDERTHSLSQLSEWLLMAAWLTYLRALLFAKPDDTAEVEKEAKPLADALRNRAFVEAASRWLSERPRLGRDVFPRGQSTDPEDSGTVYADTQALFEACLAVFDLDMRKRGQDDGPLYVVKPFEGWPIEIARQTLLQRLTALRDMAAPEPASLWSIIPASACGEKDASDRDLRVRAAVASAFVAGLDLSKEGVVTLHQDSDAELFFRPAQRID